MLEWVRAGAFSWQPLLPAFGSMIFVLGFYARRTMLTKVTSLFGNALWLTYALLLSNWAGAVGNILMLISAGIGIVRKRMPKAQKEGEA